MSLPTDTPAGTAIPPGREKQPGPPSFTLVIVSPSTGVTSPLTFPQLAATTTVSQLKAKIRDALPSKPSNEGQRIIHRGRLLGRETETMLDIFGQESLGSPEPQTLHLVLRPTVPDPPSTPLVPPQRVTTPIPPQTRPQSTPANPIHGMHTQQPLPGLQHLHQHHALHQAEHLQNVMAQRLQALQRETVRLQQEMGNIEQRSRVLATQHPEIFNNQHSLNHPAQLQVGLAGMQGPFLPPPIGLRPTQQIPVATHNMPASVQHLIQQGQNERAAAEGRNGPQDLTSETNIAGLSRQTPSGRASPNIHRPDHSTTYTREGIGPNGERWHMTVNETTSTFQVPQHPHVRHHNHHHQVQGINPALENLQAIARNTDRLLAGQSVHNFQNLQNNIGGATSLPSSAAAAGHTHQAQFPGGVPVDTSARVHPPVTGSLPPPSLFNTIPSTNIISDNVSISMNSANGASGSMGPVVYILSSPQGPHALLLNNSDRYYGSLPSSRRRNESPAPVITGNIPAQAEVPAGLPGVQDRAAHRLARRGNRHGQENNPVVPVGAAHANPAAGALGARIGPMIWLIIRLAGFVWFFTAGNSSWPRFVMITALAVVVFIINTGIFNGVAEALWGPVRRHVEALIPLAGPEAALVPAANAAAVAAPQQPGLEPAGNRPRARRRYGELDEAEVAIRLLEQRRRADGGWLLTQIRRAEHAALLFVASLVPGVGERHIAAREAEANAAEAERQRQIEAAAARDNSHGGNPETGSQQAEGESEENQEDPLQNTDELEGHAPAQPVVEV